LEQREADTDMYRNSKREPVGEKRSRYRQVKELKERTSRSKEKQIQASKGTQRENQ
jgi:hypothetical protein